VATNTERRARPGTGRKAALELPAEWRIVLACARLSLSERHNSNIFGLLRSSLDWSQVIQLSKWYRISALVFAHLCSDSFLEYVPDLARSHLEAAYQKNGVTHLLQFAEMRRVVRALRTAGVPTILLKGAALVESVYPDPAVRNMGDLDLLVEKRHMVEADRVIRGLDYRPLQGPDPGHPMGTPRHNPRLVSNDGITHIEVHHHFVSPGGPLYFDISECWANARPSGLEDVEALVLSPEDTLMHLCMGFFGDRRRFHQSFAALRQLVDISETVRHYGDTMSWEAIARDARKRGIHGIVHCSLLTASELLDAEIPPGALERLAPEGFHREIHEQFVARKVLETRPWFLHELVAPPDNRWGNLCKSAVRRLLFDHGYVKRKYWPFDRSLFRIYLSHIHESTRFVGRAFRRPRAFCQDVRVDRWMNDLEMIPDETAARGSVGAGTP
jgi:hypothetical protein